MEPVASTRALGRALLARQHLLARAALHPAQLLAQLVGLQARAPRAPYVAMWSRLEGFEPVHLAELVQAGEAVRVPLLRATVHLVLSADALSIRPLVQPVLARSLAGSGFARQLEDVDLGAVAEAGAELLEARAMSRPALARALLERFPGHDARSLGYAVTYLTPVLQPPPRGLWDRSEPARWTSLTGWLGRPLDHGLSVDALLLRYLGGFGPASVRDAQAWSGLARLHEVLDRLRPRLRTLRDESGVELFDLPRAPRPDEETPAPTRFLPEYDNVLLAHADRSRIILERRRPPLPPGDGGAIGTFLVDGYLHGTWVLRREDDRAVLHVEPYLRLTTRESHEVEAEGRRLLTVVAAGSSEYDVQIRRPGAARP